MPERDQHPNQEKDICIEVLLKLKANPSNPQDLADTLWEEMRSPTATLPAIEAVLKFFRRKELVKPKKGVYSITNEGKNALVIFFQNHPEFTQLYSQ